MRIRKHYDKNTAHPQTKVNILTLLSGEQQTLNYYAEHSFMYGDHVLRETYAEIKDYVLKEHGLKVSNLYISQVKRKCGIEVGENYNLPKSEDSRQPQCPEEKEKAI